MVKCNTRPVENRLAVLAFTGRYFHSPAPIIDLYGTNPDGMLAPLDNRDRTGQFSMSHPPSASIFQVVCSSDEMINLTNQIPLTCATTSYLERVVTCAQVFFSSINHSSFFFILLSRVTTPLKKKALAQLIGIWFTKYSISTLTQMS